MKSLKTLSAILLLVMGMIVVPLTHGQGLQTVYTQSLGPVSSSGGCTASSGVATSSTNTPCGGQGSMYQNSLVTTMTLSWTSVSTVSSCTVQLEQASTLNGTYTLLGTAQTCTSTGTYTAQVSAAYVRFNITALTTSGAGSLTVNYFGQIAASNPQSILTSVVNCGTAAACSATTPANFHITFGQCTASSATTCAVTGITPAYSGTTTYYCVASDGTTAANGAFKITYVSASAFTITTSSSSDAFNWMCFGT